VPSSNGCGALTPWRRSDFAVASAWRAPDRKLLLAASSRASAPRRGRRACRPIARWRGLREVIGCLAFASRKRRVRALVLNDRAHSSTAPRRSVGLGQSLSLLDKRAVSAKDSRALVALVQDVKNLSAHADRTKTSTSSDRVIETNQIRALPNISLLVSITDGAAVCTTPDAAAASAGYGSTAAARRANLQPNRVSRSAAERATSRRPRALAGQRHCLKFSPFFWSDGPSAGGRGGSVPHLVFRIGFEGAR